MQALPAVAHVAVEQPIDTLLDYLIPTDIQPRCKIGQRVLVPLASRQIQGYIVGLAETTTVSDPKPLAELLDETPLLTSELLNLTRWVATYYMCPWGLVLKAAVPQGFRVKSEAVYQLATTAQTDAETSPSGRAAEVLQALQQGPQSQATLSRQLESTSLGPLLRRLENQGWITSEQRRKRPATRQRMVPIIELAIPPEEAAVLQEKLRYRAPNQAAVLAYLRQQQRCDLKLLQAEISGARAAVKRLSDRESVIITQEERMRSVVSQAPPSLAPLPHLNQVQQHALQQIEMRLAAPDGMPILLHGVTGSGKTEVYMRAIATALQQGKTALVLVPEISLTSQAVDRFAARFGSQIALMHSGLSSGQRFDEWRRLLSGQAQIAIGARSAVFAPLPRLGLIVIDEEHDTSYKQEETPRYNARDVAIVRAQLQQAVVVLGSATPAMETFHNARSGKYFHLSMPERVDDKPLPTITLVDQRAHNTPNERVVSTPLRDAIAQRLERQEQSLILINRRGFAAYLQCRECGDVPHCTQCSVSLTYHRLDRQLKCHYCDFAQPAPTACSACQGSVLHLFGVGTQQVEDVLRALFPDARLGRMDRDTTRGKSSHERILRSFGNGELDILVGTQMIAKGHDYPNITLVGVISADGTLAIPDFRAPERLFQLLTQVAGRAGRGDLRGEVLIQTFRPEHDSVRFAREHDFIGFFQQAIRDRQALLYPPYTRLAKILVDSPVEERVEPASQWLAARLLQHVPNPQDVTILGPAEAPVAKIQNRFRWHILLKASSSRLLHHCLQAALDEAKQDREHIRNVRISVDIDPVLFL